MYFSNKNLFLQLVLPSIFFIICFALYLDKERTLIVNAIAVGLIGLLLFNLFLQKKIISRIFGIIFLLITSFMILAMLSDLFKGKATAGYWVGCILCVISIIMALLLILGYEKKKAKK